MKKFRIKKKVNLTDFLHIYVIIGIIFFLLHMIYLVFIMPISTIFYFDIFKITENLILKYKNIVIIYMFTIFIAFYFWSKRK
jgi:hypothetical protein